jgi:hypothetical protein
MTRADRIDNAVSAASELITALMDLGPIAPAQAKLIMVAAARAAVTNIQEFEVRDSATRVAAEIEGERQKRLGVRSENQSSDVR